MKAGCDQIFIGGSRTCQHMKSCCGKYIHGQAELKRSKNKAKQLDSRAWGRKFVMLRRCSSLEAGEHLRITGQTRQSWFAERVVEGLPVELPKAWCALVWRWFNADLTDDEADASSEDLDTSSDGFWVPPEKLDIEWTPHVSAEEFVTLHQGNSMAALQRQSVSEAPRNRSMSRSRSPR